MKCEICEEEKLYECMLCGRLVCEDCYNVEYEMCAECLEEVETGEMEDETI